MLDFERESLCIKLATIMKKRLLKFRNGKFYFIANRETIAYLEFDKEGRLIEQNGRRVDVPGLRDIRIGEPVEITSDQLIHYIKESLIEIKTMHETDELVLLNILDQDLFNANNFRNTTEKIAICAVNDYVKELRSRLKTRAEKNPDVVVKNIQRDRFGFNNIRFDSYLLSLFNDGILSYEVLQKTGLFDELTPQLLKDMMKERLISSKQVINLQMKGVISRECAIDCLGGMDSIVTIYKRAERNRNARDAKLYIELIGQQNGLKLYKDGKISLKDINRFNITKEMIESQTEQIFLGVLLRGLPEGIEFSSEELISEYITKFSGQSLIKLAKKGIIKPEDLIDVPDIEVDSSEEHRKLRVEDLIELYNSDFIVDKLLQEEIDFEFINKLNSKVLSLLDDDQREEFWKNTLNKLRESTNSQDFYAILVEMSENTEVPKQVLSDTIIPSKDIESMYYDGKVSDDDILEYYNSGMVDNETIKILFGQDYDQMIEMINSGKLSAKAFSAIPVDVLSDKVINGKLELKALYKAYMDIDAIDIDTFKRIVEDYDTDYYLRKEFGEDVGERIRVVDFIDENVDTQKLRELYIADILSHGDILELKDKKIITEEQAEEISKIDRERLFKDLFEKRIISKNDGRGGPPHPTVNKPEKLIVREKTRVLSKKKFFEGIGNCIIKKLETTGSNDPFAGYTLIGYPDYGIVILEDLESDRNNATYIMTIEEFNGFIKSNNDNSIVFKKGKQALKEECARGKAVKSRNHSALWGKNVIDTMREFSKDARREISGDIQIQYTEMMIDEYHKRDIEAASIDEEKLERTKAEIEFEKSNARREIRKNELREVKKQKSRENQKKGKEDPNHGEE